KRTLAPKTAGRFYGISAIKVSAPPFRSGGNSLFVPGKTAGCAPGWRLPAARHWRVPRVMPSKVCRRATGGAWLPGRNGGLNARMQKAARRRLLRERLSALGDHRLELVEDVVGLDHQHVAFQQVQHHLGGVADQRA